MSEIEPTFCHDCGCDEGELHDFGCDVEECPFCGWQLISCLCCYEKLGSNYDEEDEKKWLKILEKKGRIPFIIYPSVCVRCGKLWPPMFSVSDKEWKKYIAPSKRCEMLCKPCYDYIKNRIDKNDLS